MLYRCLCNSTSSSKVFTLIHDISEIKPGDFVFRRKMKSARLDNTSNYVRTKYEVRSTNIIAVKSPKGSKGTYKYQNLYFKLVEKSCPPCPKQPVSRLRSETFPASAQLFSSGRLAFQRKAHRTQRNPITCAWIFPLPYFIDFFIFIFCLLSLRDRVKNPHNHWNFFSV